MPETVILYRPVGEKELELIRQSGFKKFPPRLPEQPIFYPVLNFEYAEEIAKGWNTKSPDSGFKGYVTRFEVNKKYISGFKVQQAGNKTHLEYWIDADELEIFNSNIIGTIEVIAEYTKPENK